MIVVTCSAWRSPIATYLGASCDPHHDRRERVAQLESDYWLADRHGVARRGVGSLTRYVYAVTVLAQTLRTRWRWHSNRYYHRCA